MQKPFYLIDLFCNDMTIAAHQPNYLPNLAFFNKMALADLFVIITNLQFAKQEGWQQRHKIKGPNNDIWMTVPVLGSQNQLIKDLQINNQVDWAKKHKKSLEIVYAKTKEKEILKKICQLYDMEWSRLVELNLAVILLLKDILGIKTPVVLDEEVSGIRHHLLINVCKKYQADTYLSGVGVRLYLGDKNLKELEKNQIKHQIVEKPLTALYPYSTVHYLLLLGRKWVLNVI